MVDFAPFTAEPCVKAVSDAVPSEAAQAIGSWEGLARLGVALQRSEARAVLLSRV